MAEGGHELTLTRIAEAWNTAPMKVIMKSFLKTGITNVLDRCEGDVS
jgi:hypothetical protein